MDQVRGARATGAAMATLRSLPWLRLGPRQRMAMVVAGALVVGAAATQYKAVARGVLGLALVLVFVLVASTDRKLALILGIVGLVLLGFVRRLLIPFAGWNAQDPLLLVSPICATVLWFQGARTRTVRQSALGWIGLLLLLWAAAEIVNPAEPSLVVGAQAALFWTTPFLWFFAGRTLSEDEHKTLLTTVLWVGVVVTAHGLYQTFVGLLPFEYTWLDYSGPGEAIFLEGFKIRPFSTLTSPQEYGFFMGLLCAVIFSRLLHRKRSPLLVVYFAVAAVALFLQGTRQVLALFAVTLVVMGILRVRTTAFRLIFASSIFMLVAILPRLITPAPAPATPEPVDGSTASLLAEHQVEGFTDPMNSTLPLHIELIVNGFEASFSNPLGVGIGKTSIAVGKAGKQGINTENDVAAVFAGMGLVGGVMYLVFIGVALVAVVRLYLRERNAMHLAWAGMAVAHLTQWWSGTLYATTSILFLVLGGAAVRSGSARGVGDA